jgi:hypothetical protein
VSLRPRHWSNNSAISLDLFFLLELHCSVVSTPCCILIVFFVHYRTLTKLRLHFRFESAYLFTPWLALGEQSG